MMALAGNFFVYFRHAFDLIYSFMNGILSVDFFKVVLLFNFILGICILSSGFFVSIKNKNWVRNQEIISLTEGKICSTKSYKKLHFSVIVNCMVLLHQIVIKN